jgi:hypothetical protein
MHTIAITEHSLPCKCTQCVLLIIVNSLLSELHSVLCATFFANNTNSARATVLRQQCSVPLLFDIALKH